MLSNIMEGVALMDTVLTAEQNENWQTQGRCTKHEDPDLWFSPVDWDSERYAHLDGDARKRARQRDRDKAKEKCRACPVRAQCLQYAMENMGTGDGTERDNRDGEHGIWGGLDKWERVRLQEMLAANQAAA